MAVTVYSSLDASAPSLTGAAGSAIVVLQACLVTGYGSKLGSGWTMPYTGTNVAVFRTGSGNMRYLRVSDTSTTEARLVGYETMTDSDTGTGLFPTNTQVSGGLYLPKGTAGAVARPWMLIATDYCFYMIADGTLAAGADLSGITSSGSFMFFGDFISNKAGDVYNTAIIARTAASTSTNVMGTGTNGTYAAASGHYIARAFTGVGGSIACSKGARASVSAAVLGAAGGDFPDPITGNLNLSPIDLYEQTGASVSQVSRRGRLPGMWAPLHNTPAIPVDTVSGSGDLAGKMFIFMGAFGGSTAGRVLIETSNTW